VSEHGFSCSVRCVAALTIITGPYAKVVALEMYPKKTAARDGAAARTEHETILTQVIANATQVRLRVLSDSMHQNMVKTRPAACADVGILLRLSNRSQCQ
jgi:hypothetical protein